MSEKCANHFVLIISWSPCNNPVIAVCFCLYLPTDETEALKGEDNKMGQSRGLESLVLPPESINKLCS